MSDIFLQLQGADFISQQSFNSAVGGQAEGYLTKDGGADSVQVFGEEGQKVAEWTHGPHDGREPPAAAEWLDRTGAVSDKEGGTAPSRSGLSARAGSGIGKETTADAPGGERRHLLDDGRSSMYRLFVVEHRIPPSVFDECWRPPRWSEGDRVLGTSFIQLLAETGIMRLETSFRILSRSAKISLVPLSQYKIDFRNTVHFPRRTCRGWLVLPFDTVGRYTLTATVNPFNRQAAAELEGAVQTRVVWCLAHPLELIQAIQRIFN
jgi:hypothetical protein